MRFSIVYTAALALSLGLYGCSASSESESATQPSSSTAGEGSGEHGSDEKAHSDDDHDHDDGDHAHGDHDHDGGDGLSDMEKMKVELAKLSSEDAASALKQHFCPVSGDMLGTTGPLLKVDVDGQQVWICCEDCRDPLLEDSAKYLAKLKN